MSQRASTLTLVWLALGCSATSTTTNPFENQPEDGGSGGATAGSGSNVSGSSTSSAGGRPNTGAGGTGPSGPSTAGRSTAGSGGSPLGSAGSSGSAASSSGSTGSSGSGTTGPVTIGLPYTEDFESGAIDAKQWLAVAKQVPDPAIAQWSVIADDTGKGAQITSDGTERFLVGGNGAWTDQKIELRVQVVSGKPEVDIAFRFHAVKEYYYLEFADSHFKLRDRTGANDDLDPTGAKPKVTLGTWYKIAVQIKGTAVSASLNDTVVTSGTFGMTPIAAGGIAIGVGTGTGVAVFDDVHVTLPE